MVLEEMNNSEWEDGGALYVYLYARMTLQPRPREGRRCM